MMLHFYDVCWRVDPTAPDLGCHVFGTARNSVDSYL
jgi:hypothetical protein